MGYEEGGFQMSKKNDYGELLRTMDTEKVIQNMDNHYSMRVLGQIDEIRETSGENDSLL